MENKTTESPKIEFLLITDCLTDKSYAKDTEANDVHWGVINVVAGWSIDKDHWETHCEHPNCLKNPENSKPERV